jgi:Tfp pilus assembly protein PilX
MGPFSTRDASDERGATLVISLVFMVVFSIILAAVFTNAGANFRNTTVVRNTQDKTYSADSAIDWALQRIRNDDTICPNTHAGVVEMGGVPAFNGVTPTVTCEVLSGSVTGASGFAIVTVSDDTPSLLTEGPGTTKNVNGPVWSSGIDDDVDEIAVTNGDVYERNDGAATCSSDDDQPAKLTINPFPPYAYHCDGSNSADDILASIPHAAPPESLASASPQSEDGNGDDDCRVFSPGRYTSLDLADDNYFRSGVYFFDDVGTISVRGRQVVGGAADPDEVSTTLLTPCATDASVITSPAVSGTGVKFILGGSSKLEVRNPSGRIELFARHGGDPDDEGQQDLSLQTATGSAAEWPGVWQGKLSDLTDSDAVITLEQGATPRMMMHGGVFVPNALVDLDPTNHAKAYLLGGIVAGKLVLRNEATVDSLKIAITTGIGARQIRIIAKASGSGERQMVSTLVGSITNDADRTINVASWRTSCRKPDDTPCANI